MLVLELRDVKSYEDRASVYLMFLTKYNAPEWVNQERITVAYSVQLS